MRIYIIMLTFLLFCMPGISHPQQNYETDRFVTGDGVLTITFIGHGTLMMTCGEIVIHIDPVGRYGNYSELPKADIILVTHDHSDHFDTEVISNIRKKGTDILLTERCAEKLGFGTVIKNGEKKAVGGIAVEAVPAYNIVHMRKDNIPFHSKGVGNGYIMTFGDKRIYVAGDTENIPEMSEIKDIDYAFLPMNLPYTMSPEMVAEASRRIKPAILYPYHFGNTQTSKLVDLLKGDADIEIRIRSMQ